MWRCDISVGHGKCVRQYTRLEIESASSEFRQVIVPVKQLLAVRA